jgi:starch-binding outer membrane protein, SusD/RagB family
MKTRINKLVFALVIVVSFLANSCTDLTVENLNEPDLTKVFSTTENLHNYAGSAFRTLHNTMQDFNSPAISMGTMADQLTLSWGTAGSYWLSSEPRKSFYNDIFWPYYWFYSEFWKSSYQSINRVNDIVRLLNEGNNELQYSTEMLESWSYFVSGVAHGYLGLVYDQGDIIEFSPKNDSLELVPWPEMIKVSLEYLDKSITIANKNNFVIPENWMGGESYSSLELSQLANSYAARILTYSSRNGVQNKGLDWNRILQYANKGIQKDLAPVLGDAYDFYDMYFVYGRYPGWARIDHRIINLLDADYPSRWPNDCISWTTVDGQDPGPADSEDARLESDFQFLLNNNFHPERGYYHFSHYRHKRFDYVSKEKWYGNIPKPSMLIWENELLKAEALVRTGNVAEAITILNNPSGARKLRGNLPDAISANAKEALWTIFYERDIELILSGMGISYFDMRRRDMLQRSTILHFPVPARELELMHKEVYSILGEPDGENVSEGSWTGLDGLTSPPGL